MKPFLGIAATLVVGMLVALSQGPSTVPLIRVSAVGPPWTVTDLWNEADYVLIVEPTGRQAEHWNNAANTLWEAPDDSGIMPMIVRDEEVTVAAVFKGNSPKSLTIRNIGGVAGGFAFEYDGLYDLATGGRYLVFLATERWPTQEGFETATGFVANGQGLWAPIAGGYKNDFGSLVTDSEITAWAETRP